MTVGPAILGAGMALLAGVDQGDDYVSAILPGVIVFGVAVAVLGALPDEQAGIASAVNNASARFAQLLAGAAYRQRRDLAPPPRSGPASSPTATERRC